MWTVGATKLMRWMVVSDWGRAVRGEAMVRRLWYLRAHEGSALRKEGPQGGGSGALHYLIYSLASRAPLNRSAQLRRQIPYGCPSLYGDLNVQSVTGKTKCRVVIFNFTSSHALIDQR